MSVETMRWLALRCEHGYSKYGLSLPIPLDDFAAILRALGKDHRQDWGCSCDPKVEIKRDV